MLKKIPATPCFNGCPNIAHWSWTEHTGGQEVPWCMAHLVNASDMNSDNEEAFFEALVSPVVVPLETSIPCIIVYRSTIPAALCSVIERLDPPGQIEVLYHTNNGQFAGRGVYERFSGFPDGLLVQLLDGSEEGWAIGLAALYNGYVRRLAKHKHAEYSDNLEAL